MQLLGIDVGGTFTDIFFNDLINERFYIHKTPTTTEDPSIGIITGIRELIDKHHINIEEIDHIFHGTTIGTNSILEYDGAITGMITTKGYRDIIHIGRHQRPEHYSIMQDIPWQARPLVKRRFRKTVTERMGPRKGEVIQKLDEKEVREAIKQLKNEGVQSIIVGLLFSYINPEHEERIVEIIQEEYPEAFITSSADISPQYREFERFITACINGFIGPKVKSYITNLSFRLKEINSTADIHIMCSNGGIGTPENVARKPVNTLVSGPAAGVLGGAYAGTLSNRHHLITFDMGGTSADIGIVSNGDFNETTARDTWIAGYPVMIPMIDIHTIGAGGGSIAYIDEGGFFKVGPRSAGSFPGPACYGRGGKLPTVTDANVVLGRLSKDNFLGGEMEFYDEASHKVIEELAQQLNLTKLEAAEGVLRIINTNMANAIREKTIQKGIDPREYTLVAFGGAGPLHAVEVARELEIQEIIVPSYPGINSATGLLTTDLKYDAVKTQFMLSTNMNVQMLNEEIRKLEVELIDQLLKDKVDQRDIYTRRYAECRYIGQGYELRVPLPNEILDEKIMYDVFESFHQMHHQEYGHSFSDTPIEIVNIRVTGFGKMPKLKSHKLIKIGSLSDALIETREVVFRINNNLKILTTKCYERELIPVGESIIGPAIISQKDSTTLIPPGAKAVLDEYGNILIKVGEYSEN